MDVKPNITRIAQVAGIICLPISGVLAGIAGVCFWMSLTEPQPAMHAPVASSREAPSQLNIIQTGSLYLDSFKSASLYETYESAQGLLYARVSQEAGAEFVRVVPQKPLLAQIADSMRIVPEAQAASVSTTDADKKGQNSKNSKNGKDKNKGKEATSKSARPDVPAPVQAAAPASTLVPPAPVAVAAARTPAASAGVKNEDAFPDTFKAGSLGQLTQLRAELEQLKMQVTIEETRSKLNNLRGKGVASNMPSLDFPPIGMPSGGSSNAMRILSIQSVNGKYTATVGTGQGPKIVSINDSINGNRVVSITRNSVVINRGQGNETLTIQE